MLAYYRTLDEVDKLEMIIAVNRKALVKDMNDDYADAYFGMIRDFFNPRKEDGSIDVQELRTRMRMVYTKEQRLRFEVGKAIKQTYDGLPADIPQQDRKALATRIVFYSSPAMAELNNQHNMIHNVMGVSEGLLEETKNALILQAGRQVDAENDMQNFDTLMGVLEEIRQESENLVSWEIPEDEDSQDAYQLGKEYDASSLPAVQDKGLEEKYLSPKLIEKMRKEQDQGHLPKVAAAELLIDKAVQTAGTAELTDLAAQAYQILEGTGSGESTLLNWHFFNSGKYGDVLRLLNEYRLSLESGQATAVSRDLLIRGCLNYLEGKETVRNSQHGKIRFETIMTLMSEVMPTEEFERLTARVNQKRGAKPGDPSYVSPEKYRSAAARSGCRVFMTDDMEKQFRNVESVYGLVPSENERWIDSRAVTREQYRQLSPIREPINAVGEAGLMRKRDFVAVAYSASLAAGEEAMAEGWLKKNPEAGTGASLGHVENARVLAKNAIEQYHQGNKSALAGLISAGLRTIAENRRIAPEMNESWVMEGEIAARLQRMLESDPELKRLAKDAGLTQQHLKLISGARVMAGLYAKDEQAREEIQDAWDNMSFTRAKELYADLVKGAFVRHMVKDHEERFRAKEETQSRIAELWKSGGEKEMEEAIKKAGRQLKKPCSLLEGLGGKAERAKLDKMVQTVIEQQRLMEKSPKEMQAYLADRKIWANTLKPALREAENALSPRAAQLKNPTLNGPANRVL